MSIDDIIPPLMFATVLLLIFSGYPVAFALAGASLLFIPVGIWLGFFDFSLLGILPNGVFNIMGNYTLLAVPYFIFMGNMLERSGLAEDLLKTIGQLFGPMRGGLAVAVILVGTLLAAATGVVGATVVSMALISLPVMLRFGYSQSFSTGVIAASGTLGQVIPPSVVLIVLADQMGVSVGSLFRGSLIPGLLLASAYGIYALSVAWLNPSTAPALPPEERPADMGKLLLRVVLVLIPPLLLILLVLGSIFAGVATPTEAGAFGAVGAIVLAAVNGRLKLKTLLQTMDGTAKLTAMIMFILVGSRAFALVFRGFYGDMWVEDLLTGLPGGAAGFLLLANLAVFVLGFFIDFFEIAFIVLPLLVPAARLLGIDLTWFGVMIAINLQTSFLTPPFGFSLFYLRGATPSHIRTTQIYKGVIPFILIQLLILALVIWYPPMVTWLGGKG
ncbi:TRAP transporter large permease [Alkalilimnicola sp. S0819]|uniref:TRAP transporter large permease n=1 Tax=Alkalilimnicola sp. S0819 TaxID=2613922 RepID=UPI0012621DE0|nr:TRAP transporter large permease subunit [Alkalilimnicola sp. S0819]KAB7624191.1 TRAP transporter large permease subunit [Alkalilimnicola sp. S0819]MPQ16446.1 TRAP transporter large permease subunit [Alkalilimnicola sp. S0819]